MSTTPPSTPQPLNGGNVYFPTDDDAHDLHAFATPGELVAIGAMFAITLLAGFAGICLVLGYGWAHLLYLLQTLAI